MQDRKEGSSAKQGFTLIELLVVIAIIGLLSTIAIVGMNYIRQRARDTRRVADINTLQKALEVYMTANTRYPVVAADVCITGSDSVSTALKSTATVSNVPTDPLVAWASDPSKCFLYKTNDGTSYELRYTLELNTPVGTAGDHTVKS